MDSLPSLEEVGTIEFFLDYVYENIQALIELFSSELSSPQFLPFLTHGAMVDTTKQTVARERRPRSERGMGKAGRLYCVERKNLAMGRCTFHKK